MVTLTLTVMACHLHRVSFFNTFPQQSVLQIHEDNCCHHHLEWHCNKSKIFPNFFHYLYMQYLKSVQFTVLLLESISIQLLHGNFSITKSHLIVQSGHWMCKRPLTIRPCRKEREIITISIFLARNLVKQFSNESFNDVIFLDNVTSHAIKISIHQEL